MIHIIIIALIVNMIISQVIATSVRNRQISSTRVFWISFLLSPLVGMFVAIMSPEAKPDEVKERLETRLKYTKTLNVFVYFILIYLCIAIIIGVIRDYIN